MARRSGSPVVILSILLVLSLAGWFAFDYLKTKLSASSCDSVTTLRVVAAPDIAPALVKMSQLGADECYRVDVSPQESGPSLQTLGASRPDVWVPETSLWLQRAQQQGTWNIPVSGPSIAASPMALGLTEDAAKSLQGPTWAKVFNGTMNVGFVDPAVDPAGLSALIATRDITKTAQDPGSAYALLLRKLSKNTTQTAAELFNKHLDGVVASESALRKHNLVGVYADPAIPSLDFPYVVLPWSDQSRRDVAQRFLSHVLDKSSAPILADQGLRTPDGQPLPGAAAVPPVAPPTDQDQLLNQWAAANRSARLQVLLDVSGSMAASVPKAKADRMTVTLKAADLGIRLFKPTTKIGLWLFSTNLDGDKDYKEFTPVAPVSEVLTNGSLDRLREVRPIPGGATGLYDSVLAAYRSARQNWEPGRINLVVVLTDGKNEDRNGITREQLLSELAKLQDPRRPLQVMGVGIGPDIDPAELRAIAQATGGDAYTTTDPTKIIDVFYAAMGRLLQE